MIRYLVGILLACAMFVAGPSDAAGCSTLVTAVPPDVRLGLKDQCSASSVGKLKPHLPLLADVANMLISNNYEYLQLAAHFSRDTINWDGYAAYFQSLSDESWEHALELVKYANKRGYNIGTSLDVRVKIPRHRRFEKTEPEALAFALDKEKNSLESFVYLLKNSDGVTNDREGTVDPLLNNFLESKFAAEGTETVRELSGLVNNLHDMSGPEEYPLAVYHMNKVLKKLAES